MLLRRNVPPTSLATEREDKKVDRGLQTGGKERLSPPIRKRRRSFNRVRGKDKGMHRGMRWERTGIFFAWGERTNYKGRKGDGFREKKGAYLPLAGLAGTLSPPREMRTKTQFSLKKKGGRGRDI